VNADDVLNFWFGPPDSADYGQTRKAWWQKDPAFDELVRQRFGQTVEQALGGKPGDWPETPRGALAYVIALDQFPRNIFRGTPRAFAGDHLALAAASGACELGLDQALPAFQRVFLYMPFMHSEGLGAQQRSLDLFDALAHEPGGPDQRSYARSHYDIIARFGRFPHRNATLGRESTPEELLFLQQPGSSF
jgi:uncharacterized protein (DUF924 family)